MSPMDETTNSDRPALRENYFRTWFEDDNDWSSFWATSSPPCLPRPGTTYPHKRSSFCPKPDSRPFQETKQPLQRPHTTCRNSEST